MSILCMYRTSVIITAAAVYFFFQCSDGQKSSKFDQIYYSNVKTLKQSIRGNQKGLRQNILIKRFLPHSCKQICSNLILDAVERMSFLYTYPQTRISCHGYYFSGYFVWIFCLNTVLHSHTKIIYESTENLSSDGATPADAGTKCSSLNVTITSADVVYSTARSSRHLSLCFLTCLVSMP